MAESQPEAPAPEKEEEPKRDQQPPAPQPAVGPPRGGENVALSHCPWQDIEGGDCALCA